MVNSNTSATRRIFGKSDRILLALTITLGLLACATALGPRDANVPRQGWWAARGPVVPHDSFPADCGICHVGDGWSTMTDEFSYDHEAETGVPLVGMHREAECLRCHNDRGPVAVFAQRGCAGCHEDVHRGQLGTSCDSCHAEDTARWSLRPEIAQHDSTRFPLIGTHAAVSCWRCHSGAEVGDFVGASVECVDCHMDDLARALNPDHVAQGFTQDCEDCHIPTTWGGAGFTHDTFPLTGAHRTTDCSACHLNDVFAGTPRECVDCHLDDFNATTDPDHAAQGFSTDCDQCHNTTMWDGAMFDHNGIVDNCVDCHLTDYNGTTDPDHASLGISMDCELCHVTTMWDGALFDHAGIMDNCVECHLTDFLATTDPNHTNAGFPTSCETCHGTNMWEGAVFDHDFPIDSGNHKNLDCVECHTVPTNFAMFSCIDCHEHSESRMDDKHSDVNGYTWDTPSCYSCHPNGND